MLVGLLQKLLNYRDAQPADDVFAVHHAEEMVVATEDRLDAPGTPTA